MHCHDGAARSGLTLAADLLLYILDHNQVSKRFFKRKLYYKRSQKK